jgi:hypothetical protein
LQGRPVQFAAALTYVEQPKCRQQFGSTVTSLAHAARQTSRVNSFGELLIAKRYRTAELRTTAEFEDPVQERAKTSATREIVQCVRDFLLNVWRQRFQFRDPRMAATLARQHHHGKTSHSKHATDVLTLWARNREGPIRVGHRLSRIVVSAMAGEKTIFVINPQRRTFRMQKRVNLTCSTEA